MTTIALARRTTYSTPARRETEPALRLTRRGRFVVTLLFVVALLIGGTAIASNVAASGVSGSDVVTTEVTVGAGDTLWAIASEHAEAGKTQEMIRRIKELNALSGSTLQVGQVLAIPAD